MARMLGGLLLIHFVIVCAIKTARGVPDEILWMSHIGLLLAGIGFVFHNATLLAAATIAIFVLHALWLGDCVAWLTTGHFPLGITTYLRDADAWVWLATAHHFYLIGLLPWCVTGRALGRPEALLLAVALYLSLTVASRAFTDPGLNVNFAFGARIGRPVPFFDWANRQPGALYLPGLNAFVAVAMFWPVNLVARMLGRRDGALTGRRVAPLGRSAWEEAR
jgi:hypothetical protein